MKPLLNSPSVRHCSLPSSEQPRLVVVVDTEEEFDWTGGFSREQTSVLAMRRIDRIQAVFDEYRIVPVYVVDYPIVSQPDGYRQLQEIVSSGRGLVGSHLHPWVNPPFEESVTRHNSFPGNLPPELESAKLQALGDLIESRFGSRPTIYKAGRYGLGPHTTAILEAQGYEVDLSVCPCMDYSAESGPDFSRASAWPYWFGHEHRMLELPLTVGYTGFLRAWGQRLDAIMARPIPALFRLRGVLSRLNLLDKLWLSPEGYSSAEHIKLVRTLYREGLRVFSFAFHSPSVEPGYTPYVRTQEELDQFLGRCRRFFDFILGELCGRPTTPLVLKRELTHSGVLPPVEVL